MKPQNLVEFERRRILKHLNQAVLGCEKHLAETDRLLATARKPINIAQLKVIKELKSEELDNWHRLAEVIASGK